MRPVRVQLPGLPVPVLAFNRLEAEFLYQEIFKNKCYTRNDMVSLGRGDCVVDIGANIGLFSLQAMGLVGAQGRVLAVEALPPTYSLLHANIHAALSGTPPDTPRAHASTASQPATSSFTLAAPSDSLTPASSAASISRAEAGDKVYKDMEQEGTEGAGTLPSVVVRNLAVAGSDSTLQMSFFPFAAGWGTAHPESQMQLAASDLPNFIQHAVQDRQSRLGQTPVAAVGRWLIHVSPRLLRSVAWLLGMIMTLGRREFMVESRGLSSLLQDEHVGNVDLLKVDVEGGELQVLEGIDDLTWRKIRQVALEVHSDKLLEQVVSTLHGRFTTVRVLKDESLQGTQLHMVYAHNRPQP